MKGKYAPWKIRPSLEKGLISTLHDVHFFSEFGKNHQASRMSVREHYYGDIYNDFERAILAGD